MSDDDKSEFRKRIEAQAEEERRSRRSGRAPRTLEDAIAHAGEQISWGLFWLGLWIFLTFTLYGFFHH